MHSVCRVSVAVQRQAVELGIKAAFPEARTGLPAIGEKQLV